MQQFLRVVILCVGLVIPVAAAAAPHQMYVSLSATFTFPAKELVGIAAEWSWRYASGRQVVRPETGVFGHVAWAPPRGLELGAGGLGGIATIYDENERVYLEVWQGGLRLGPALVLPTSKGQPHRARLAGLVGIAGSYAPRGTPTVRIGAHTLVGALPRPEPFVPPPTAELGIETGFLPVAHLL